MRISQGTALADLFGLGRRGAVAVWIAVMMPGLIMVTALAVEAGGWSAAQMSLQRAADVAAMAGAMNYQATSNKQTAATFAARIAQLNGGNGMTLPTWTTATNTLTDNQITAQVITGYQNSSDTALKVSVQKTVPAIFSSTGSYTVTGTGTAELVSVTTAPTGAGATQPCLLALSSSGTISGSGSTSIDSPNCSMVSNGTISFSGGGSLDVDGVFVAGSSSNISIPSYWSPQPTQYANNGTIADPYAHNTALQNNLTTASGLSGVTSISCSNETCTGLTNGSTCSGSSGVTCTLQPGNYGGLAVTGGGPFTFNFQPGLYLFQGAVSMVSATTTINGTGGVTIIAAGGFEFENQPTVNVTAPTPTQVASQVTTNTGVAGVALASQTTTTVTLSGSSVYNVIGVTYLPNATFNASGSSGVGASASACTEIIAASIELNGSTNFAGACSSYGATSFTSSSGSSTTAARVVH